LPGFCKTKSRGSGDMPGLSLETPRGADDLVQNCLVRTIAKEHLWEPGTDLRAWLFTILHNQNVNEVRRSVREGVAVAMEDVTPALMMAPRASATLQLRDLKGRSGSRRKNSGR
jgi:RNA polymerase sigma-70 factor (ECF subfamily)